MSSSRLPQVERISLRKEKREGNENWDYSWPEESIQVAFSLHHRPSTTTMVTPQRDTAKTMMATGDDDDDDNDDAGDGATGNK